MSTRTRKSEKLITETITREDAELLFAEYAKADGKHAKLTADLELKITQLREKYQDDLGKLAEAKDEAFKKLQHFATTNPELFTRKKSLEFTHGILGFRTGNPALKTLKGFTWAAVLELVRERLPDFVRIKEEVAKDELIARRDDPEVAGLFAKVGVQVVQDEAFYVEPKKESAMAA